MMVACFGFQPASPRLTSAGNPRVGREVDRGLVGWTPLLVMARPPGAFFTGASLMPWACDCIVGGGKRDADVHHVGCSSQGAARRAMLVYVARGPKAHGSRDVRARDRAMTQGLAPPLDDWAALSARLYKRAIELKRQGRHRIAERYRLRAERAYLRSCGHA